MKKVWEVIKKIGIWIFTVLAAIFAVLFIKEKDCRVEPDNDTTEDINAKAAKKREEAISRIECTDARTIAENYDGVCDAIADGKERFRRRVADCGRRN
ncbi:MAG: hypothetical protein IK024_12820 [Treponema sp.]|nr:hypothetical protein [Treponema sp.]